MSLYGSHIHPLLVAALNTKGNIIEMGAGNFSTPLLHGLSEYYNRRLYTYESDGEWLKRFANFSSPLHSISFVRNWDDVKPQGGLVLIDHAPAERRMVDIIRFKDIAEVLVVHDTNKAKFYGYNFDAFKYKFLYDKVEQTTTLVSNFVDVSKFRGW